MPASTGDDATNGADLTSNVGPSYQWYLNGQPIGGAIGQQWTALANGDYTVEHTHGDERVFWRPVRPLPSSSPVYLKVERIGSTSAITDEWTSVGEMCQRADQRVSDLRRGRKAAQRIDARMPVVPSSSNATDSTPRIYLVRVERDGAKWEARFHQSCRDAFGEIAGQRILASPCSAGIATTSISTNVCFPP
ncbi:MAG: hypothetical protein IPP83_12590 [Flavobacteriales bacterium]|nr:hypothetical protein [Flavobacteriales bacterium]